MPTVAIAVNVIFRCAVAICSRLCLRKNSSGEQCWRVPKGSIPYYFRRDISRRGGIANGNLGEDQPEQNRANCNYRNKEPSFPRAQVRRNTVGHCLQQVSFQDGRRRRKLAIEMRFQGLCCDQLSSRPCAGKLCLIRFAAPTPGPKTTIYDTK